MSAEEFGIIRKLVITIRGGKDSDTVKAKSRRFQNRGNNYYAMSTAGEVRSWTCMTVRRDADYFGSLVPAAVSCSTRQEILRSALILTKSHTANW